MKFLITITLKIGFFLACACVAGYFIYVATILMWNPPEKANLQKHDAVIVLTGGPNRIEQAFTLLLAEKADRLLITGVLNAVPIADIVANNSQTLSKTNQEKLQNHCCIAIDYVADTTETNAIESAKWISQNNIKSIILVTSASHMPRGYLQFKRNLDKSIIITSYPTKRGDDYDLVISKKFWSYALREYTKFIGSWIRLENTSPLS